MSVPGAKTGVGAIFRGSRLKTKHFSWIIKNVFFGRFSAISAFLRTTAILVLMGRVTSCHVGQLPRDMSLGAGFAPGCPHANSRSPNDFLHGRGTGRYRTHRPWGATLGCLRVWGTRRSCGVVLGWVCSHERARAVFWSWCYGALVFCAGENTLGVAANANAGSDRLRRNSSAGTTRKHVDRASLRSRMRLHRLTPKKLVGSFHGCGFQVP